MTTGNVVTNNGKLICFHRLYNVSPTYTVPSRFQVGIGTTTPAASQTSLVQRIPISGVETVDACDATTGWTGNADTTIALNNTTFKYGTGSLNLTKTGTAGTALEAYKTTTSLDFTSKELSIWIYVKDLLTLSKIGNTYVRFGSDGSNYYYWQINSLLIVGWNYISNLTVATATTTGSPVIAACDYTYLYVGTALASVTWSAGDLIIDQILLGSSDDYNKAFVSGYPILNETDLKSTIRTLLLTTDANGYALTEFGIFNTDGTPKMFSRLVNTAITKTSTVQVIYVERDMVT